MTINEICNTHIFSKLNSIVSASTGYYSRNDDKFKETCLKNRLKRKNKKK